jgi:hypothetical protein
MVNVLIKILKFNVRVDDIFNNTNVKQIIFVKIH